MCAERPTSSEVQQWLERAAREGQEGVSGRVAPLETALQRLTAAVEEDRAQALSVAGDYTPQALQVWYHAVRQLHCLTVTLQYWSDYVGEGRAQAAFIAVDYTPGVCSCIAPCSLQVTLSKLRHYKS